MPISITTLTAPRTIEVAFGDEKLSLTYRPAAINAAMEEREQTSSGRQIAMLAESLAELIAGWDVVDEKGKPVKPTTESIAALGFPVMRRLRDAITADWLPN